MRTTVSPAETEPRHSRREAGEQLFVGVSLLAGAWLLVSPLIFQGVLVDAEEDLVIGLLLVVLGGYGVYRILRGRALSAVATVLSFFAGMWLIAFSLTYGGGFPLMDDNVVVGAVLAATSLLLYRRYFHDPRLGE